MYHTSFHACILPNCLHTHICTYTVCVCVCDMFLVVYHLCILYTIMCVYVYDLKVELCTLLFHDSLVLWAVHYVHILFICCPTCHVHESCVNCCLCYITYSFSHSLPLSLHLSPFLSLPLSFLSVKVNNKGYCIRS